MRRIAAACAVAVVAVASSAQTALEHTGDTTGLERFHRPDGIGSLSFFADDVAFEPVQIEVSRTGQYTILSDQTNFGARWDGYLLLYEGGFDSTSPLDNLIALNDDYFGGMLPGTGIGYSGIENITLTEGVPYFIVTTGYDNDDDGPYQVQASGEGDVRVFTCFADMNGDSQLNIFDFLEFQNLFGDGHMDADCNDDGALDIFDFLCFQDGFAIGCE